MSSIKTLNILQFNAWPTAYLISYSHSQFSPLLNSHNILYICVILAVLHSRNLTTLSRNFIICPPTQCQFHNSIFLHISNKLSSVSWPWNTVVIHHSIHHLSSEELADKRLAAVLLLDLVELVWNWYDSSCSHFSGGKKEAFFRHCFILMINHTYLNVFFFGLFVFEM